MKQLTGKKLILLGVIFALLAIIPAMVYFVGQQQDTRSRAAPATNIYFSLPGEATTAATLQTTVNQTFSADVVVSPGSNVISLIRLEIDYDPTKVELTGSKITASNGAEVPGMQTPVYEAGKLFVTFAATDLSRFLQGTPKTIATVSFKALAPTTSTPISFGEQTQVLTGDTTKEAEETGVNLLSGSTPLQVSIGAGSITTTPTATPSATLTPGTTTTPTATPVAGTQVPNVAPTCTALNIDRTPSGTAPFAITFTAVGSDTDGTISKVTFNFGDGPVEDVTTGGGIGSKTLTGAQATHSYNNAGTYRAQAIITDNRGGTSLATACTQTITVIAATGSATTAPAAPTSVVVATATSIPTPTTASAIVSVTPPGPGETIIGVGVVGTILTIIGGLLFFSL